MGSQFMDLIFYRRSISPNALQNLSSEIREKFGHSTKYVIHLKFKKRDGWDIFRYPFIFDTGAVLSYAPLSILEDLKIKPEFELSVGGINPDEKCRVITKVAKVSFKIMDDINQESQKLTAWFAFHPFTQQVCLLGMKNVLDSFNFRQNSKENKLIITI